MTKKKNIALLYDLSRVGCRGLVRGFLRYASLKTNWLVHTAPPIFFPSRQPGGIFSWLKGLEPDGVVVAKTTRLAEKIIASKIPAIVHRDMGDDIPGVPNIKGDGRAMGKMAAEHLAAMGLTNLGFCSFGIEPHASERGGGFREAAQKAGCRVHTYTMSASAGMKAWQRQLKDLAGWLKKLPRPTGIMGANDEIGRMVVQACDLAGLEVPEEMAVLGVGDDHMVCTITYPPLSSVALTDEQAGFEAAGLLEKMMAKRAKVDGQAILVRPSHVVGRLSTELSAVTDPALTKALKFIRENAGRPITAAEVVRAAAMSRSALAKRFQDILHHPVHEFIVKARAEKISQMLRDTNMTVAEIAYALGFDEPSTLTRYFGKAMGMSPRQYRQQHSKLLS